MPAVTDRLICVQLGQTVSPRPTEPTRLTPTPTTTLATCRTQTHRRLERVVDPLLKPVSVLIIGTRVPSPRATMPVSLAIAPVHRLAHERHDRVCGVRDDGAEDARKVTRRERHAQLRRLAVRLLGRGEDVLVEQADNVLEEGLLHRVRHLCECRAEPVEHSSRCH